MISKVELFTDRDHENKTNFLLGANIGKYLRKVIIQLHLMLFTLKIKIYSGCVSKDNSQHESRIKL